MYLHTQKEVQESLFKHTVNPLEDTGVRGMDLPSSQKSVYNLYSALCVCGSASMNSTSCRRYSAAVLLLKKIRI